MLSKIIQFVKKYQSDIILIIGVILISLLSFAMGYITAKYQEKTPVQFEIPNSQFLIPNKISNDQMPKNWKLEIGNWKLL